MTTLPVIIGQAVENYIKDLAQVYQVDHAILFGSYADGTARWDSDIDIAIFSEDATEENRLDMMADCLLRAVPYNLDIQPVVYPTADYTADNDFIQKEIIGKGIELPVPDKER